ncbi:hypothetical protein PV729_04400 [Streptomyces europaeiscabiei]|uniref:Uncharacterized protein n=1 Tax=Streptomyces europaeiscabiei TaxID=146819 RepID=A0ABU4N790_9ACTN|nr:hypothetical protein [Streptomyces europaeiscabiei]MDX3551019.1 hypothetical protein [Streptomyces europaeiscabiei]MDX3698421.1 hypothetical protein [Streptomyces europaeiscabiei]
MDLSGVAVGDTLILSDRGQRSEVTVTKVGRKYLYVGQSRFSIETGVAADGYGHSRVRTLAQVAEADRRTSLLSNIKALGLEPTGYGDCTIPTETLERVLSALQGDGSP